IHSFQHQHIVKCVAFSPDGSLLATGSNEKLLRIYDLNNPTGDPFIISGHTSGLRHIAFLGNGEKIVSCADDRTVRFWERSTGKEIHRIDFTSIPNGMEVSNDDAILTVASGNTVSFWNTTNFEKIKEYQVPSQVHSASLHPSRSVFVCGGEDFKMYKIDYSNGQELESFKGHFGPVHCVRFSPDGELYASGSEDGTLRLWQTTVGKSYGLWKCSTETPTSSEILSPAKAETAA
ncbi:Serine-threonine kinase receptor-associated protein, partial [Daphnia magna]